MSEKVAHHSADVINHENTSSIFVMDIMTMSGEYIDKLFENKNWNN